MLTLYQAEWCPFSSAVREILTELGLDFLARQVEPWPEDRARLEGAFGSDQIPILETEDGKFFVGTRAIYGYLSELEGWEYGPEHRGRFLAHLPARESDSVGQLVGYFPEPEREEVAGTPDDSEVVHVPEESRYELRLGGRKIGEAAYHRARDANRIAFTHTEVDASLEGRGFGSRLTAAALDDAREQGLEVIPLCSFVAHYIDRHPEYHDLVADTYARR